MDYAQITNQILMVRPARFGFNHETAASNSFQQPDDQLFADQASELAQKEFDQVVESLLTCGVDVFVVEDTPDPVKTDAVFPNNWISFHPSGLVVTYPMMSQSRRQEVREEVLEDLQVHFAIKEIWRLDQQSDDQFLEGTGSMVLDRQNRIAFACRSPRTDETLLNQFCDRLKYRCVLFDAIDSDGIPVYHTNVVMALTEKQAVICLESIPDATQRETLREAIAETGKSIVEINANQVRSFAGNMLQVGEASQRPLLVMSKTAHESLNDIQLAALENESDILAVSIPVIEKFGGGSIRCMLAEIFVEPRESS